MTPTVVEIIDPTEQLQDAPEHWAYTPCNGKKVPIDPATGRACEQWPSNPFTLTEIATLDGQFESIGLITGPPSGTMTVDFDGPGSDQTFKHHIGHSIEELPPTLAWTSGRPDRHQRAYAVPEGKWDQLKQKVTLKCEGNGQCELRWSNHQSVISGPHLNPKGDGQGFYSWCDGASPADVQLAEAPEWLLEALAKATKPKNKLLTAKARKALSRVRADIAYDIHRTEEILTNYAIAEQYGYDDWLMVGMVCHYLGQESGQEEHCFNLWDSWSARQTNYHEESEGRAGRELCEHKWSSFNSDKENAQKFGTLLTWAQLNYDYKPAQRYEQFVGQLPNAVKNEHQERTDKISTAMKELYRLEKIGGDWSERQSYRSVLGGFQVKRPEQDDRLLMMLAEEWGLQIGEGTNKKRTRRTLSDASSSTELLPELIPGFVYQGADTIIHSKAGEGKTLLAIGMNYHASMGGRPIGQSRHVDTTKIGRTLWIGTDGGELAFGMLKKYVQMLKAPGTERWADQLEFWGANKETGDPPWAFTIRGVNELLQELQRAEDEGDPYVMVTLDSAKAVLELAGINFGIGPVGTVMRFMQAVAARFNIGVLWIHHSAKNSGGGLNTEASGNANFTQIPYAVIRLARNTKAKGYNHVVTCFNEKLRGNDQRRFFDYTLDTEYGLFKEVEPEGPDTRGLLYEIWMGRDSGVPMEELINSQPDIPDSRIRAQMTEMCKQGLVRKASKKWWPTPKGASELVEMFPDVQEDIDQFTSEFNKKRRATPKPPKGGGVQNTLLAS